MLLTSGRIKRCIAEGKLEQGSTEVIQETTSTLGDMRRKEEGNGRKALGLRGETSATVARDGSWTVRSSGRG